jgi:chemotaxis protein MotB
MPNAKAPIIVIKKKGGHGGHHGGAWKVAYADFVTAMMALFIVLWLMNTSKPIKEAIAGYFQDPAGTADKAGKDIVGSNNSSVVPSENMAQLKADLEKKLSEIPNFEKFKSRIEMKVTEEGLRIELLEGEKGTFFDSGSQTLNGDGREALITLAQELGKLPNKLSVEGHTDAKPYSKGGNYTNWELSSDRANAARRLLQENGVGPDQVKQVRGFADQSLRKPENPLDPSNRRISLIVHYLDTAPGKSPDVTTLTSPPGRPLALPSGSRSASGNAGASPVKK